MPAHPRRPAAAGFTLVELAVVLVVIGLLAGGVLAGRELIEAARVRRVLTEKDQFTVQVNLFQVRYGRLPGDLKTAQQLFPACLDNGNNPCNGNGDGVIGQDAVPYGEGCRFWEHLSRAGLLPNQNFVYVNNNSGFCDPTEVPKTAYSPAASWQLARGVGQRWNDIPAAQANVHYFVLQQGGMFARAMAAGSAAVSPANARALDQKVDDGNPVTGQVLAGNDIAALASAPYPVQNRYCLTSSNEYASPVDTASWTYYTGYDGDAHGCKVAFEADF